MLHGTDAHYFVQSSAMDNEDMVSEGMYSLNHNPFADSSPWYRRARLCCTEAEKNGPPKPSKNANIFYWRQGGGLYAFVLVESLSLGSLSGSLHDEQRQLHVLITHTGRSFL